LEKKEGEANFYEEMYKKNIALFRDYLKNQVFAKEKPVSYIKNNIIFRE
jgi:hypothetical protein